MPKIENGKPCCNCGWQLPDIALELDPKDKGIAYTIWLRYPQCQSSLCQTNEQSKNVLGLGQVNPWDQGIS